MVPINTTTGLVIVSVVKDEVTLNCTSVMRRVLEKRRGVLKADGVNHT